MANSSRISKILIFQEFQLEIIMLLLKHYVLYLSDKLFPFLPNVKKWSTKGKVWFEQEIEYQIYPDGTFLQFSMNYHRVVIQLLTHLGNSSYRRLTKDLSSMKKYIHNEQKNLLDFLQNCSEIMTLANSQTTGANDGALIF